MNMNQQTQRSRRQLTTSGTGRATFAWAGLIAMCLVSACANPPSSQNPTTKPVGTTSRVWLDEQRNNVNRADPEPYPASRAASAVQRYEATAGAPTGGASTAGGSRPTTGTGAAAGGMAR